MSTSDTDATVPAAGITAGSGRRTAFNVFLVLTIVILLARSPVILVLVGWFLGPYEEATGAGVLSHRVHEVSFGILFTWALVGAASQWRYPLQNIAGMLQLIATVFTFTVAVTAATGTFEWLSLLVLVPVAGIVALHPAGTRLFVPALQPSPHLMALASAGALWLLFQAAGELQLAASRAQGHTSHWAAMGSFMILLVILSGLAALRPVGYRVVAASLGLGAVLFSLAAKLYPFDASSTHGWPLIGIWGLVWLVVAFRSRPEQAVDVPNRSAVLRGVGIAAALVGGFLVAAIISSSPPNVPHNLETVPELGFVSWADADRRTCLTCHATGSEGAVVVPHPTQTCDTLFEACIEARSDCLGCHAFDPILRTRTAAVVPEPSGQSITAWQVTATPLALDVNESMELRALLRNVTTGP